MQVPRSITAISLLGVIAAACGGSPGATAGTGSPTQAPGGGTPTEAPGGGTPTEGPVATQGGGGNPANGTGQIHIEIGGPKPQTVDQPFFAFGSRFGGAAGVQLNFTSESAEGIAGITGINDQWIVTWSGAGGVFSAQNCSVSNWDIGTTSGHGSFDCKDGFATTADGQYLTGVTLKGNFTASQ